MVDIKEAAIARAGRVVAPVMADLRQSGRDVLIEEELHARSLQWFSPADRATA
jgi:hypothetical protein